MESSLCKRYIRAEEFSQETGWDLVEWCRRRGADRFRLSFLQIGGHEPADFERIDAALEPFQQPGGTVPGGEQWWVLSVASIEVLKQLLPGGIFQQPSYDNLGWLEDLTVLRQECTILAIISHEGEGALTLTSEELSELEGAGFPLHDRARWI